MPCFTKLQFAIIEWSAVNQELLQKTLAKFESQFKIQLVGKTLQFLGATQQQALELDAQLKKAYAKTVLEEGSKRFGWLMTKKANQAGKTQFTIARRK